jgi:hypothetical protein
MMQDKVHKDYKDTPALWSMCWMNFWCSLYNCVYLFGVTSAGWDLLGFCREFPEVRSSAVALECVLSLDIMYFMQHMVGMVQCKRLGRKETKGIQEVWPCIIVGSTSGMSAQYQLNCQSIDNQASEQPMP